eukprot:1761082-Pleurochrysis_carterae.AAC.1
MLRFALNASGGQRLSRAVSAMTHEGARRHRRAPLAQANSGRSTPFTVVAAGRAASHILLYTNLCTFCVVSCGTLACDNQSRTAYKLVTANSALRTPHTGQRTAVSANALTPPGSGSRSCYPYIFLLPFWANVCINACNMNC